MKKITQVRWLTDLTRIFGLKEFTEQPFALDEIVKPTIQLAELPLDLTGGYVFSAGAILAGVANKRWVLQYAFVSARNIGTDTGTQAWIEITIKGDIVIPLLVELVPSVAGAVNFGMRFPSILCDTNTAIQLGGGNHTSMFGSVIAYLVDA